MPQPMLCLIAAVRQRERLTAGPQPFCHAQPSTAKPWVCGFRLIAAKFSCPELRKAERNPAQLTVGW